MHLQVFFGGGVFLVNEAVIVELNVEPTPCSGHAHKHSHATGVPQMIASKKSIEERVSTATLL